MTSKGPAIGGIGVLKLVNLHCSIQRTKCALVNSATCAPVTPSDDTPNNSSKDLKEAYLDQFDWIGNFAGEYHIVLRPNNHSIVHVPRKCSIHMRDNIKAELDEMVSQGIIYKVDELMDWVNNIEYVRKRNGKLRLCLDPMLYFDLSTRPKMPFKVMHRKEVTHSNGSYERKSRGRKLAHKMGQAKKSHDTLIDWRTGKEWPLNCMTVISAWWRLNIRFQRSSGRRTII